MVMSGDSIVTVSVVDTAVGVSLVVLYVDHKLNSLIASSLSTTVFRRVLKETVSERQFIDVLGTTRAR